MTVDEIMIDILDEWQTDVGVDHDVYVSVVPVTATFPCIRYHIYHNEKFQTKDGASLQKYHINLDFIAKEGGVFDGDTKNSAFDLSYDAINSLASFLVNYEDSLIDGANIDTVGDGFEFETLAYYSTIDLSLIVNTENEYTMFSIEPKKTGSKIGGKHVWVAGVSFGEFDWSFGLGESTFDFPHDMSGKTIIDMRITSQGIDGLSINKWRFNGEPYDVRRSPLQITTGAPSPGFDIGDSYWFVYYTID